MAEVSLGTEELPLYLTGGDGDGGAADREGGDDGERRHVAARVPQGLVSLGRAAHGLQERFATPTGATMPPGGYETRRSVVIQISRHLVMTPAEAIAAFDEWRPSGTLTATSRGSLHLGPPLPAGPTRLRAAPGRLGLRLSPVPIAVELELVGWGDWRAVLTLRPERRLGWPVGPHRRSRYFAAGHATMDVIVHRLQVLAGVDGLSPYHRPPCGPSSSTPIPAPTA